MRAPAVRRLGGEEAAGRPAAALVTMTSYERFPTRDRTVRRVPMAHVIRR